MEGKMSLFGILLFGVAAMAAVLTAKALIYNTSVGGKVF